MIVDGYTSYSQGVCTGKVGEWHVIFDSTLVSFKAFTADEDEHFSDNAGAFQQEMMSLMHSPDFKRLINS